MRVGHSIWLPRDLEILVEKHATALGLSFNNVVVDAILQKFDLDRDPLSVLMQELRMWLLSKYDRTSFPEDVILQTFTHIHETPHLMARYNQIIEEGGHPSTRAALNRRVGQAVHNILGGTVRRRRVPSRCPLVKVYSTLTPTLHT